MDLPASNGAELAIKEINAAGGVLGKQLEFVLRDSKYQMDTTAVIAKQFVEEDKVAALIGFTDSDSVLAAGPIIQDAGIPFITAGAIARTRRDDDRLNRHAASPGLEPRRFRRP